MLVSLGPHLEGAACPHVDPNDSETVLDGIKKRIAVEMPKMKSEHRQRFRAFVKTWLQNNFKPVPADYDYSVEHWLEQTNYPYYRKQQLLAKNKKIVNRYDRKHDKVKSFIKNETYITYKHARTINSRTDEFKTLVGPYVKAVEKIVFKHKWFIKYISKRDRPKALLDRFDNKWKYIFSTDFSSFEAHFVELLEDTEFQLYEYMLSNCPTREFALKRMRQALLGFNTCVFKWATVKLWRRRMSGEMSTSLGNGFANLMLILYILTLTNENNNDSNPISDPYVEGDDGIFGSNYELPDNKWLYNQLGLDLKISRCEDVSDASFCGNVFDKTDLLITTNPIEALLDWGWTTDKYIRASDKKLKQLLRAKSYSLLYEYPGHPILQSAALYGLRMTNGLKCEWNIQNEYQRDEIAHMLEQIRLSGLPTLETPSNTRKLVEKLYGITVEQQHAIELYFNNKNDFEPVKMDVLRNFATHEQRHYYEVYFRKYPLDYRLNMMFPPRVHETPP